MSDFDAEVVDALRAGGGVLADGPLAGVPLLLLTHKGARTGRIRTTPLGFYDDVGVPVVFGSGRGAPSHPQWVHNLLANPGVAVELGGQAFSATARLVVGDERVLLWARLVEEKPFLAEHQARAGAWEIPLFRLEHG